MLQTVSGEEALSIGWGLGDVNRVGQVPFYSPPGCRKLCTVLTIPEGLDFVLEDRQVLVCLRELEPNPSSWLGNIIAMSDEHQDEVKRKTTILSLKLSGIARIVRRNRLSTADVDNGTPLGLRFNLP